jgi:hypothetical protein
MSKADGTLSGVIARVEQGMEESYAHRRATVAFCPRAARSSVWPAQTGVSMRLDVLAPGADFRLSGARLNHSFGSNSYPLRGVRELRAKCRALANFNARMRARCANSRSSLEKRRHQR